ncbi:MAG TPA: phosphotransferase, partial [Actinoplanes sp.]|nr:phosphotransferase [Actinoplanes sp.]
DVIRSVLRAQWHCGPAELAVLPSGPMSYAWAVTVGDQRLVARLVDHPVRSALEAGVAAAVHLRERGFVIGRPLRTLAGSLTAQAPAGTLSLVHRVPGRALSAVDPLDQQWWGDRLGAAHRGLAGFDHQGLRRWTWLHPQDPCLDVEPWLRPAITDAANALTRLTVTDRLTYGVLHGDPTVESFVMDPATGRAGLLDWGACGTGPLVYDVAAAVVQAGGPDAAAELIDGYLAAGPISRGELDAALPVLMRVRWAVLAERCARRLAVARSGSPGSCSPADLAQLLAARQALAAADGCLR